MELKHNVLFNTDSKRLQQKTRLKFWRNLYGYKQKVGEKVYVKNGLVKELHGRKLGDGIFAVPKATEKKVEKFLHDCKIVFEKEDIYLK